MRTNDLDHIRRSFKYKLDKDWSVVGKNRVAIERKCTNMSILFFVIKLD